MESLEVNAGQSLVGAGQVLQRRNGPAVCLPELQHLDRRNELRQGLLGGSAMTPTQSRRIRFGILAARHMLERGRLTDWQRDDVEGMEDAGWRRRDSEDAFDHEFKAAMQRD